MTALGLAHPLLIGGLTRRTRESMSVYKAEYIWTDGTEPTPLIRSKTRIVAEGEPPPLCRRVQHQPGPR